MYIEHEWTVFRMFLCTLSVFVCCLFVNSDAQETKQLSRGMHEFRKSWRVPQEIKDLVPVDFAVSNLRDSRLKNEIDRSLPNQGINEVQKSSKFGATKRFRQKNRSTNRTNEAIDAVEKISKKSNKLKITPVRKYLQTRTKSSKKYNTTTSLPEPSTTVAPKENLESDLLLKMRLKGISPKSMNTFASIRKAMNALPEELVKIIRDDSDCNDDPEKKVRDVRGPPCALSPYRWTGSSGELWLSPRNIINRNWKIPIN